MFNLNLTPILFMRLRLPTNANRNSRKLTCSITIVRDLWKITQIGSIGLGTYLFSTNIPTSFDKSSPDSLSLSYFLPNECLKESVSRNVSESFSLKQLPLSCKGEKDIGLLLRRTQTQKRGFWRIRAKISMLKVFCQITNCFFVN